MEKYIYDEKVGLWYELIGDYYYPCLVLSEEEERPIGSWGRRHWKFIKEHRRALFDRLLLSGKLNRYLADVDREAEEWLDTLMERMAKEQGVDEALKAADQMAWVGRMNNIRAAASEIVDRELIYC